MKVILIENHNDDGVEWGVSFTSSNPEPQDYVACKTADDAVRLQEYLEKLSSGGNNDHPKKRANVEKQKKSTSRQNETFMIQIRHGAEYPIICNGKNHYYLIGKFHRCDRPFEKCTGRHPQI